MQTWVRLIAKMLELAGDEMRKDLVLSITPSVLEYKVLKHSKFLLNYKVF